MSYLHAFQEITRINKKEVGYTLLAVVLGFVAGAVVIWVAGYSVTDVYTYLYKGVFGSEFAIGTWLAHSTPIIFTALSFIVAFRCGLFNIGAEGQLYVGAFAAAWVGFTLVWLPPVVHVIVAIAIGAGAGALWGFIPGWLRAKRGCNEFVSSMMLSYVAIYITGWFVCPTGPFRNPRGWANMSPSIAATATLPRILPPSQLSVTFIIAVVAAIVIYYILWNTPFGYEVRAVGVNPEAARYGGIKVKKIMILAFVMSGILAGIGGAGEILGTHRVFIDGFSPGYGWDGIAVALIAHGHPIFAIFAGLLVGGLRAGALLVEQHGAAPADIGTLIEGFVILFVIAPILIKSVLGRK